MNSSISEPVILKKLPPPPSINPREMTLTGNSNLNSNGSSNSNLVEWVRMLLQAETAMERLKPQLQEIQEKREIARNEILKRVQRNGQIETPYGKVLIQFIETSPTIGYESILEWIRSVEIPGTILPSTTTIVKSLNELLEEDFINYYKKHSSSSSSSSSSSDNQSQKGYRRLTFISNRKKTRRRKSNEISSKPSLRILNS
jgi:hypothetical protein